MNPDKLQSTDSWEEAVANYVKSLEPDKRRDFQAPTTVEECLQVLSTFNTRKSTRVFEFLRPVIDPLKRLEGTIDVVVQVNSGIASPIWGPLRMAITIACQHLSALERFVFIIDKIAQSIQRYQDLETLFTSHTAVREAVGRLYCELLRLCTCMIKYQTRRLRYILNPFGNEFASISESIDYRAAEIDRAAQAAHFQEAKELREQITRDMREQNLHRIRCWLCPSTVEDNLYQHLSEYSEGSCDWILQSDEFQRWLSSPGNDQMEILGRPGSGKSTLAAFLVQHLSQCARVLYFFCDRENSSYRNTRGATYMIRTLLAQLLHYEPNVADLLLPAYQRSGRTTLDSMGLASELFYQAIAHRKGGNCYFVIIDNGGLDGEAIRRRLFHVCNEATQTKVLFTESCETTVDFDQLLRLTPSNMQDHIRVYIERRIQRMTCIANTELGAQVATRISNQADGLWLYARLLLDEIERAPSRKVIEDCLSSLPQGLAEIYDRIVQENDAGLLDYERRFARCFYLWLDVNDILPNFLIGDGDHLPIEVMGVVFQYTNGGDPVFDIPGLIKRLGGPLVEVRQTQFGQEVAALHESFYQYLPRAKFADDEHTSLQKRETRVLRRARAAIWYFTECQESEQHLDELRSTSSAPLNFYKFESHFLFHYALLDALWCLPRHKDPGIEPMLQELTEFLVSGKFLRWFEISTIVNYSGNFTELFENVLPMTDAPLRGDYRMSGVPETFKQQRRAFFMNWKYVLLTTTPWGPTRRTLEIEEPPWFSRDPICQKMMEIAAKWSHETDIFARQNEFSKPSLRKCRSCWKLIGDDFFKRHTINCRPKRK